MSARRSRARRWLAGLAALALVGGSLMLFREMRVPGSFDFAVGPAVPLSVYRGADPTGAPAGFSASTVARGRYLAIAADCAACHTVPGGAPFAGGNAFRLPFGTLYSPNITRDVQTGIGGWTDGDFLAAVHQGRAPHGVYLYPVFPYPDYSYLTDADVLAIKAYLFSLPAIHSPRRPGSLRFPYDQRWLMAIWSRLYDPDRRFEPRADRSSQWNRGAYLVEALEHCGECHTPRNWLQALDGRRKFAGAITGDWRAFNITPGPTAGIRSWSDGELAQYLHEGYAPGHGTAAGPMGEAVDQSLRYLSPSDIRAIVMYLRTIPAQPEQGRRMTAAREDAERSAPGSAVNDSFSMGQRVFAGACIGCHTYDGAGREIPYAAIRGAAAVDDSSATNVIQVLLHGSRRSALSPEAEMPSFAGAYSDRELAAVAGYVTARFGHFSDVTPDAVASKRTASSD